VELGKYKAFISTLIVDEVTCILLKQKASELLNEDRHYKIVNQLKENKNLFLKCYEIAQKHIDYILALEQKGVLSIINQMPDLNLFSSTMNQYWLFPRNATHLSIMLSYNIPHIITTDKDFLRVDQIKVHSCDSAMFIK